MMIRRRTKITDRGETFDLLSGSLDHGKPLLADLFSAPHIRSSMPIPKHFRRIRALMQMTLVPFLFGQVQLGPDAFP